MKTLDMRHKGRILQIPVVTTAERDALSAEDGFILLNKDALNPQGYTGCVEYFTAGEWRCLGAGTTGSLGFTGVLGGPQGETGLQGATGIGVTGPVGPSVKTDYLKINMMSQATNTAGFFKIQEASGSLPQTNPYDQYQNGLLQPYVPPFNWRVSEVYGTVSRCAVAQGSVGPNPSLRVEMFNHDESSRSSLGSVDLSVDSSLCGVYNNLGTDAFQSLYESNVLGLTGSAGDLVGFQFTNRNSTNEEINAAARLSLTVVFESLG